MSIANELSSEVASAVLSREGEESSAEPGKLRDVVMSVHSALREMRAETRRKSPRARDDAETAVRYSASNGR